MGATFSITKIEFKKLMSSFKVSDKNVDALIAQLDKSYKHINAISLADQLTRFGLKQSDIANIFRRLGVDDITISNIFDVLEEERIKSAFGRLIELSME